MALHPRVNRPWDRTRWSLRPRPRALHVFVFFLTCFVHIASACDQIPAGQTFRVRLLQPVSSYSSKAGTPLRAIIIESPECEGEPVFPVGTEVFGKIASVQRVGLGFRHETAALELQFDRILPEDGPPLAMHTRVVEVDNAREIVRHGVIRGVRITDTPQAILTTRLMHLPTWDPDGLWILAARRAAFPIFPEPEIYFPPGTDLLLLLSEPMGVIDEAPLPSNAPTIDEVHESDSDALDKLARSFPTRTENSKGGQVDVVNLAFLGTQSQLEAAFRAAGWSQGDPITVGAISRQLLAVLSLRNYSALPMEKQWLNGKPNDLAWQKGLDSYGQRDHLRIWSEGTIWQDEPVWISSATHDRSAALSIRKGFIHRVDSDIDEERSKIVRDLSLAGCVDSVHETSRSNVPDAVPNGTGDMLRTDDAISVVQLRDCSPASINDPSPSDSVLLSRPPSRIARYIRAQVLSFRSDVWRSNAVYMAAQVSLQTVHALRSAHHPVTAAAY